MKMNLQNFSGIFHADLHTYSIWGLWILSIPIWLTIITFGIWAIVEDFFDSTHSQVPQSFTLALLVFFTMVLPVIGLIIGSTKVRRKPGVYLRGIRVSSSGIETGTLKMDLDVIGSIDGCERTNFDDFLESDWTRQKTIKTEDINILIELRTECNARGGFFFERIDISSKEEVLYQLINSNGVDTLWKDLVILTNGSIQFLKNNSGIPPNLLFQHLEIMADAISTFRPSHPPSCTLKIVSSSISLNNVLAFGMLGGVVRTRSNSSMDKDHVKIFPDKQFLKLMDTFLEERGWSYSN